MAVAGFLARSAERDILQDGDVVVDGCSGADDKAGGVIEEDALADPRRGWMSVWNTSEERLCR